MKRVLIILFMVLPHYIMAENYIKIGGGGIISSHVTNNSKIFKGLKNSFSLFVGIDYLDRNYFYMSSEIGFHKAPAGVSYVQGDGTVAGIPLWLENVSINTTFRLSLPFHKFHTYIGLGPDLSLLTNYNSDSNLSRLLNKGSMWLRLRPECGVNFDISSFRIGLNLAYLTSISGIKYNYFSYNINVGFKF